MQHSKSAALHLNLFSDGKDNYVISLNDPYLFNGRVAKLNHKVHQKVGAECRAAIAIRGPSIDLLPLNDLTTHNVAVAQILIPSKSFYLISAYFPPPPNGNLDTELEELDAIIKQLPPGPLIICSDTNCRSVEWGDCISNSRGVKLYDFILATGLTITNCFSEPTFRNAQGGSSLVDLILTNGHEWLSGVRTMLSKKHSNSDHCHLLVSFDTPISNGKFLRSTRRFKTEIDDWSCYLAAIERNLYILDEVNFDAHSPSEVNLCVKKLEHFLIKSASESLKMVSPKTGKRPAVDHNEYSELDARIDSLYDRWCKLQISNPLLAEITYNEYCDARRKLVSTDRKLSQESWRNFVSSDCILKAYKVNNVCRRSSNGGPPSFQALPDSSGCYAKDVYSNLMICIDHFFPISSHPRPDASPAASLPRSGFSLTPEKLRALVFGLKPQKSPGHDGIVPIMVQKAFDHLATPLLKLFNSILRIGYFPLRWKHSRVVLIPKANFDPSSPPNAKMFRPIALSPNFSKLLERATIDEINYFLYSTSQMNENQFGFVRNSSCTDALLNVTRFIQNAFANGESVIAVSLDIAGAFDAAAWYLIVKLLIKKGVPGDLVRMVSSFFSERKVSMSFAGIEVSRETSQGAPQGSVYGPFLWNLLLNDLFEFLESNGIDPSILQAYADDSFLKFRFSNKSSDNFAGTNELINRTLKLVYEWGQSNHLDFNPSKTTAVLFTRSRKVCESNFSLEMNDLSIGFSSCLKYLGVFLDSKLTYYYHISKTLEKAKKALYVLDRYCSNTWGPNAQVTRLLISTVIQPIVTYAAPVWFSSLTRSDSLKVIRSFDRICNLRANKSYRTSSAAVNSLLAGDLPLELKIYYSAQCELVKRTGDMPAILMNEFVPPPPGFEFFTKELVKATLSSISETEISSRCLTLNAIPEYRDLVFSSLESSPVLQRNIHWLMAHSNHETRANFLSALPNRRYDITIFTDGSRDELGTGAGFVYYRGDSIQNGYSLPLHSLCSNNQAERLAILASLEFVLTLPDLDSLDSFLICSDSMSTLQALMDRNSPDLLIHAIRGALTRLSREDREVSFVWVKAHSNITGNEIADKLAKAGARLLGEDPNLPHFNLLPISCYKERLNRFLWRAFLHYVYNSPQPFRLSKLNDWSRSVLPNPLQYNAHHKFKKLPKVLTHYLSCFLTRHGPHGDYLTRIEVTPTPICPLCFLTDDSPYHSLFCCVGTARYSRRLYELGILEPKDIPSILLDSDKAAEFAEICKEIIELKKKAFSDYYEPP